MVTKVLIGPESAKWNRFEVCNWAKEQFGGDFVFQWEIMGDSNHWMVANFRNEEDAAFFKLKFGL